MVWRHLLSSSQTAVLKLGPQAIDHRATFDMTTSVRQACILVGGKGTRLGDITRAIPKPLLEIGEGIAFLDLLIEQVARQGFNDVVLLAGYFGDLIQARYNGRTFGSARVRVLVEPEPRGTAGALMSARDILQPRFILLNGDSFFDINMRALVAEPDADGEALIALRCVPEASRYGSVQLRGNRVIRFCEKAGQSGRALINAGIYVVNAAVVDRIHSLPCSIETDIFPILAAEGKLRGSIRDGYFLDIGLPETLQQGRRELLSIRRRPAAFLDRDGVINRDHGYVHRPDQVEWIPGAQESVRRLNDLGYRVVVVTNQAGVAHGYYGEEDIVALHDWIEEQLASKGAFIDAFYYCPYHPNAIVEEFRADHSDRKPNPGMILRALSDMPIDKDRSFLIGDKDSDVQCARNAGIKGFLFAGGNLAEFVDGCVSSVEAVCAALG
jgi:D,D-heptose 1,7-bisphosphate phosphatase